MRKTCSPERLLAVATFVLLAAGCQQADQQLPFGLADGEGATLTIGPNGGIVSVPPSFSMQFPAGSLSGPTSVQVTPRISEPFPRDAGQPVPGSAYDIGPAGTTLGEPATVEIAVPSELLQVGEDVLLAVAVLRGDGTVATFGGTYDVTNGVLTAEVDELGPVAAIISLDAISVALGVPPELGGGTFPQPSAPAPAGPATANGTSVLFEADCSPEARQCFSSGLIRIWADETVRTRLGDDLFLLNPTVSVSLDFITFDTNGSPIEVVGSVEVGGDLRARFNSSVSSYELEEGVTTGPTGDPVPTAVQVAGTLMTFGQTTTTAGDIELDETVEFGITGIGTTEMMTIEVEAEVDFDNEDGSVTTGLVTAHVRLRVPES